MIPRITSFRCKRKTSISALRGFLKAAHLLAQRIALCGKRGPTRAVWAQFADDPEALTAAVERITASADGLTVMQLPEEGETTAVEGRIVFREHRARERDPRLVRAKKDAALKATGRLACEACDLDFSERYGPIGEGFIECHHTVPLGQGSERVTSLSKLALLCSNCHRMVHHAPRPPTVAELRELLS